MTNTKAFMDTVKERGIKFSFVAEKMGLTPNGLRKKVNNESEFKASEIQAVTRILRLSSARRNLIFFS